MATNQLTKGMEGLTVQESKSSSSDECECNPEYNRWEYVIGQTKAHLKQFKFPDNVCPHCFWVMYKEVVDMIWPDSKTSLNDGFVKSSINIYTQLFEIFKECRSQHGSRFCVDHFNIIMKLFQQHLASVDSVTWALPKQVHKMYLNTHMSWLRCNIVENHKKPF